MSIKHTAAGIYSRFARILCKAPCFVTIESSRRTAGAGAGIACAEIAANVMLAEVRADHVLINRSGAVQEIRLPAKATPDGIVKAP